MLTLRALKLFVFNGCSVLALMKAIWEFMICCSLLLISLRTWGEFWILNLDSIYYNLRALWHLRGLLVRKNTAKNINIHIFFSLAKKKQACKYQNESRKVNKMTAKKWKLDREVFKRKTHFQLFLEMFKMTWNALATHLLKKECSNAIWNSN